MSLADLVSSFVHFTDRTEVRTAEIAPSIAPVTVQVDASVGITIRLSRVPVGVSH